MSEPFSDKLIVTTTGLPGPGSIVYVDVKSGSFSVQNGIIVHIQTWLKQIQFDKMSKYRVMLSV